MTVTERLFAEGFAFDFFQAVRLLARVDPRRRPVGLTAAPRDEIARFIAHLSLSFPPSPIYEIERVGNSPPLVTVAFLGLTGPSGVLPRGYTELLIEKDRTVKDTEAKDLRRYAEALFGPGDSAGQIVRYPLRAWLDQVNHRLGSAFY